MVVVSGLLMLDDPESLMSSSSLSSAIEIGFSQWQGASDDMSPKKKKPLKRVSKDKLAVQAWQFAAVAEGKFGIVAIVVILAIFAFT